MTFKAVFIGDSFVGKTSIFWRLNCDIFHEKTQLTVGGSFTNIIVKSSSDNEHQIGFWDTAGQERYRGVVPLYFQNSDFIIIVYDITSQTSFKNVEYWVQLAKERAPEDISIFLIGNKSDLKQDREIEFKDAIELQIKINAAIVCEVSAKTGDGFDGFIYKIAEICDTIVKHGRTIEHRINSDLNNTNDPQKIVGNKKCEC